MKTDYCLMRARSCTQNDSKADTGAKQKAVPRPPQPQPNLWASLGGPEG